MKQFYQALSILSAAQISVALAETPRVRVGPKFETAFQQYRETGKEADLEQAYEAARGLREGRDPEEAKTARPVKLVALCAIAMEFRGKFDPRWDPSERVPWHPIPPEGAPAGVAPSAIKDPEPRKQYEAAIAEAGRKLQFGQAQAHVHRLYAEIVDYARGFIARAFPADAKGRAEAEKIIDSSPADAALKAELLKKPDAS